MQKPALYVIAYDIPNDGRRNRLAKLLEGYGDRVNYSVFECPLSVAQMSNLRAKAVQILVESEDKLRIYPLDSNCAGRIQVFGPGLRRVVVDDILIA
jgi:CRISPR-associated protein Cas2